MLQVDQLIKKFNNVIAVNDISFEVQRGMIFGLLGPNGAGKTTTIRCILNIIKPTSGRITFENQPVSGIDFRKFGYLPEERGLYKKSKVEEVILYLAKLKGLSSAEASDKFKFWVKQLNLEDVRDKKVEELSKGNQQKVQFIIAVLHEPEIIILDEPFAGFDPINQQIIKEQILKLSREGKIIILSMHQMETAEKLCNKILLINKGMEVLSGDLSAIKQRFGGNFLRVGFSGNSEFLKNHPAIKHTECYNGYAEVQLHENISPSGFLREISSQAEITHFSVIEATLNKIFLDSIKEN
jgi:ABC-2 type transport system ATP-binding protein